MTKTNAEYNREYYSRKASDPKWRAERNAKLRQARADKQGQKWLGIIGAVRTDNRPDNEVARELTEKYIISERR